MVVGRNSGVVGLTGFSRKKMCGLLFGQQKSGRNKLKGWTYQRVVVWRGSTVRDATDAHYSNVGLKKVNKGNFV